MKRANQGTKLQGDPVRVPAGPPGNPSGKNPRDARDDDKKQAENREELGVGEDHKTRDMEEKNRGTFP
jgi:hypothetical protein